MADAWYIWARVSEREIFCTLDESADTVSAKPFAHLHATIDALISTSRNHYDKTDDLIDDSVGARVAGKSKFADFYVAPQTVVTQPAAREEPDSLRRLSPETRAAFAEFAAAFESPPDGAPKRLDRYKAELERLLAVAHAHGDKVLDVRKAIVHATTLSMATVQKHIDRLEVERQSAEWAATIQAASPRARALGASPTDVAVWSFLEPLTNRWKALHATRKRLKLCVDANAERALCVEQLVALLPPSVASGAHVSLAVLLPVAPTTAGTAAGATAGTGAGAVGGSAGGHAGGGTGESQSLSYAGGSFCESQPLSQPVCESQETDRPLFPSMESVGVSQDAVHAEPALPQLPSAPLEVATRLADPLPALESPAPVASGHKRSASEDGDRAEKRPRV